MLEIIFILTILNSLSIELELDPLVLQLWA